MSVSSEHAMWKVCSCGISEGWISAIQYKNLGRLRITVTRTRHLIPAGYRLGLESLRIFPIWGKIISSVCLSVSSVILQARLMPVAGHQQLKTAIPGKIGQMASFQTQKSRKRQVRGSGVGKQRRLVTFPPAFPSLAYG